MLDTHTKNYIATNPCIWDDTISVFKMLHMEDVEAIWIIILEVSWEIWVLLSWLLDSGSCSPEGQYFHLYKDESLPFHGYAKSKSKQETSIVTRGSGICSDLWER